MSAHYSRFSLNTYSVAPYFQEHLPEGYPLPLVLQKARAFRRLPPNLRKLSEGAKRWMQRMNPDEPAGLPYIDQWYDDEGYELDPSTRSRLTDQDIDKMWGDDPSLDALELGDIPEPEGGFPDPDTWEPPPPPEEDPDEDERISREQLMADIKSHGREYVARDYGLGEAANHITSDEALARAVFSRQGRAWPQASASAQAVEQ